jgi:hypothetical protein
MAQDTLNRQRPLEARPKFSRVAGVKGRLGLAGPPGYEPAGRSVPAAEAP